MKVPRGAAGDRAAATRRRLVRTTAASLLVLAAAASLAGASLVGAHGAASAVSGVGLTAILFGGGLLGLRRPACGRSPLAPVLVALALRLMLYAAAVVLITRAEWLHGPSLASATAASIAVMIAVELLALAREPVAELELDGSRGVGAGGTTDG